MIYQMAPRSMILNNL